MHSNTDIFVLVVVVAIVGISAWCGMIALAIRKGVVTKAQALISGIVPVLLLGVITLGLTLLYADSNGANAPICSPLTTGHVCKQH
jgi:hypothetical protein